MGPRYIDGVNGEVPEPGIAGRIRMPGQKAATVGRIVGRAGLALDRDPRAFQHGIEPGRAVEQEAHPRVRGQVLGVLGEAGDEQDRGGRLAQTDLHQAGIGLPGVGHGGGQRRPIGQPHDRAGDVPGSIGVEPSGACLRHPCHPRCVISAGLAPLPPQQFPQSVPKSALICHTPSTVWQPRRCDPLPPFLYAARPPCF